MRRSRVLVLAGVAAVGVLAVRRRRQPRAKIPMAIPFVLGPLAVVRALFDLDLSLGSVLDGIGGFFSGVIMTLIGDIVTPIGEAIVWAASRLITYVNELSSSIFGFIGDLAGGFGTVVAYIEGLYNAAIDYATNIVSGVLDQIDRLAGTVSGILDQVVQIATDAFWSLINDAMAVGGWLYSWVYDNFIQPIYGWVSGIFAGIADTVYGLVNELLDAAFTAGSWLWDRLQDLIGAAISVALEAFNDIISVVQGAWNFLVWVALHPLDWFTNVANEALDAGPQWFIDHMIAAVEHNESSIEDFIDRAFG